MQNKNLALSIALVLTCAACLRAAGPGDRLDVGDYIPSYASTKCGGIDDGVAVGKTTCYTCRSGNEPIFYIFAAKRSEPLVKLVKEIEKLVAAKQKLNAKAVVNFIGDPADEKTRREVAECGKQHDLKRVALTVTADGEKFDLDDGDEVTVILFEKAVIRLRNSAKAGHFDDEAIHSIVRRSKSLLD